MSTIPSNTDSAARTLGAELDAANPNTLAAALALVKLGTIFTPIEEEITNASAGVDIVLSKKALLVQSVRVTDVSAGSEHVGAKIVQDSAATPVDQNVVATTGTVLAGVDVAVGTCVLSADRTKITFAGTVKKALVSYIPMPDALMTAAWTGGA